MISSFVKATARTAAGVGVLASALALGCSDNNGTGPAVRPVERQVTAMRADTVKGVVGVVLDSPLVVRVLDAAGNPIEGEPVAFSVLGHGGVNPLTTVTDGAGYAHTQFTFGTQAGPAAVVASTDSMPSGAAFHVVALVGAGEAIQIAAGDAQIVTAGDALPVPLTVVVSDKYGNPVPGITVSWTADAGALTQLSNTTDANGRSVNEYTTDGAAGAQTVTASIPNGKSVDFTATGVAGSAESVVIKSGNGQSAAAGATLAKPLTVKVVDQNGNPVHAVAVTWTASAGSLSSLQSQTDTAGIATTEYTMDTGVGGRTVTAAIDGGASVTFAATAVAGPAEKMLIVAGDSQTAVAGTQLPLPLVVEVTDTYGNPVSGATVTWSATAGSLTQASTTTGADGKTTDVYTLGAAPDGWTETITAHISSGASVNFKARGT